MRKSNKYSNIFKIPTRKVKDEDEIYDPYQTLVQIQGKKNLISKIKSIPVIIDKKYIKKDIAGMNVLLLSRIEIKTYYV